MAKLDRSWIPTGVDLDWIESIGRVPNPVFAEMEAIGRSERVPILSRDAGRVLAVLATGRCRIVEVGTAIGYSTLWMALAQPTDGTIATIDPDTSRTARARDLWRRAGVAEGRITVVNAPALDAFRDAVPELAGPFDLAFIDALKHEYAGYFSAIRPRLAPGALVVADNVLWSGRTSGARPAPPGDDSEALRAFCEGVAGDADFETSILPVGDGLLVAALRS